MVQLWVVWRVEMDSAQEMVRGGTICVDGGTNL